MKQASLICWLTLLTSSTTTISFQQNRLFIALLRIGRYYELDEQRKRPNSFLGASSFLVYSTLKVQNESCNLENMKSLRRSVTLFTHIAYASYDGTCVTSGASSAKRKYIECVENIPITDLGCFVSYIEIDDTCFINQLMKINEFFLSLELWFEIFVCHLSQS